MNQNENQNRNQYTGDRKTRIIRKATMADLDQIAEVEAVCFPPAEAAEKDSFIKRMEAFLDSFIVMEDSPGHLAGYVAGMVTDREKIIDEMFEDAAMHQKDGAWQSIFSLCVRPEYQNQGNAAMLMQAFIDMAKEDGRRGCILTCKDKLIHYYAKFGYENLGVSESVHGGAVWYDMLLRF